MAQNVMEFKRGDAMSKGFSIPAANFVPGGTLWFIAKSIPDNDNTDASAVIKKSFDDSVVTDVVRKGVSCKRWQLDFDRSDIVNVTFLDGAKKLKFLGEFQYVPLGGGSPTSYPADDKFIEVYIYADLMRGES